MTRPSTMIFVSAGDHMELEMHQNHSYDLYICYYGQSPAQAQRIKDLEPTYYFERKGSKMQNFHYLWISAPSMGLDLNYDYYALLDDDIYISKDNIKRLFEILDQYQAWVLQPSFTVPGRISHSITRASRHTMRFVNFIEVTCMFMSNWALKQCMKVYDPVLIGWGIDYLFIQTLGKEHQDKFIIVDQISVCNPIKSVRELSLVEGYEQREQRWKTFAALHGLTYKWTHMTYRSVPLRVDGLAP